MLTSSGVIFRREESNEHDVFRHFEGRQNHDWLDSAVRKCYYNDLAIGMLEPIPPQEQQENLRNTSKTTALAIAMTSLPMGMVGWYVQDSSR